MNKTKIEQIIDTWTDSEKDEAYRYLWFSYVVEDTKHCLDDNYEIEEYKKEDLEKIAESVAFSFVYDGNYDCNLSYWRNIENLIDEKIEEYEGEE